MQRNSLENGRSYNFDVVVVGAGALGLLTAVKAASIGQNVLLTDRSKTVANGPSIDNHGWLHNGTVHAVSVDPRHAESVVQQLQYGYNYLRFNASECLVNPLDPIFITTKDVGIAQRAITMWDRLGVPYKELNHAQIVALKINPQPDIRRFYFQSSDLRINTVMLYAKLLHEFRRYGGIFQGGTDFEYVDDHRIKMRSLNGTHDVRATNFVYATGNGLSDSHKKLTGRGLPMTYWKSHLLAVPRFFEHSVVSLDKNKPIVINHGEVAIVNRGYDEYKVPSPDMSGDEREIRETIEVLLRMYPTARAVMDSIIGYGCIKPAPNGKISEPIKGHYFITGKNITLTPLMADSVIQKMYPSLSFPDITPRPMDQL